MIAILHRLAAAGCRGACEQGRRPQWCDCTGAGQPLQARATSGLAPLDPWHDTEVHESTTMAGVLDGQAPAPHADQPMPLAEPLHPRRRPAPQPHWMGHTPVPYTAGDLLAAAIVAAVLAALVWASAAPGEHIVWTLAAVADALAAITPGGTP